MDRRKLIRNPPGVAGMTFPGMQNLVARGDAVSGRFANVDQQQAIGPAIELPRGPVTIQRGIVQPVVDQHHYGYFKNTGAKLQIAVAQKPFIALHQSQTKRNFLAVTYASGTTGVVGVAPDVVIGFGSIPDFSFQCWPIVVGLTYAWDAVVPQDDVWIAWPTNNPGGLGYVNSLLGITWSDIPADQ